MNALTDIAAQTLPNGICVPLRDADWHREMRLEVMRALVERERHSLLPNLLGVLGCLVLSFAFPEPRVFALALGLRLVAIAATRVVALNLRARLALNRATPRDLWQVGVAMTFAGGTWGMLALPVMKSGVLNGPAMAMGVLITAGACLITSMLGAAPLIMSGFICAFLIVGGYGLPALAHTDALIVAIAAVVLVLATAAFALGTARQQGALAGMLVDVRRLGEDLASALAHAEFLSRHDALTGLLNRRAFFEEEHVAIRPGFLIAIDLDRFKSINDGFGHATGDRVLVAIADTIRAALRDCSGKGHRAARMGGEEFLIELMLEDIVAARSFAEDLRSRIAGLSDIFATPDLAISASIGITERCAGEEIGKAASRADAAMYRAKRGGRNRVIAAVS